MIDRSPRLPWCRFTLASMLCLLAGAPVPALAAAPDDGVRSVLARPDAPRREAARERRDTRREHVRDRKTDRREKVRDRKSDRREQVRDRKTDRREHVRDRKTKRREQVRDRRSDHREHVHDRLEHAREHRRGVRDRVEARRADWREAFAHRFRARFDADGDGVLSESEKAGARHAAARRRMALARRIDADRDGFISDAEWARFHAGVRLEHADPLAHLESNESDLAPEQRAERRASINERRLARLEEIDADGDGRIVKDEMARAHARRAERSERPRARLSDAGG